MVLGSPGRIIEVSGRAGTSLCATGPKDGMSNSGEGAVPVEHVGHVPQGWPVEGIYVLLKGFLVIKGNAEHFPKKLQLSPV